MNSLMTQVRRLPIHEEHARLGAKFMQFAEWEVPLQYSTIVEEHLAVRTKVGIFDVSHMGKFSIHGEGSFEYLQEVFSNDLEKIGPARAIYGLLLNDEGGIVDDIIVYEINHRSFFMIVNAATSEKDFEWLDCRRPRGVRLTNESFEKSMLAVQGPKSEILMSRVFGPDVSRLRPFDFQTVKIGGTPFFVTATGYTGERGFEIVQAKDETQTIYRKLLEAGEDLGARPAGFGARDTLRLEAKYLLYGQDMDESTTPLEAGLAWVCGFSKHFIGKQALVRQKSGGLTRTLIGFELAASGVARHGHEVLSGEERIGVVTSGTFSPSLQRSIGLAYVLPAWSSLGSELSIRIREKRVPARVVKTPFYSG